LLPCANRTSPRSLIKAITRRSLDYKWVHPVCHRSIWVSEEGYLSTVNLFRPIILMATGWWVNIWCCRWCDNSQTKAKCCVSSIVWDNALWLSLGILLSLIYQETYTGLFIYPLIFPLFSHNNLIQVDSSAFPPVSPLFLCKVLARDHHHSKLPIHSFT